MATITDAGSPRYQRATPTPVAMTTAVPAPRMRKRRRRRRMAFLSGEQPLGGAHRQCRQDERRIRRHAGGEGAAAEDQQVAVAVVAQVAIDDAVAGIDAHAGGALDVRRSAQVALARDDPEALDGQ